MKRAIIAWGAALVAVAVALGAGYRWGQLQRAPSGNVTGSPPARKVLYWYDPMVPGQHFDKPGLSPMGMQLVPKYGDQPGDAGIAIDPGQQQSLGIRTVPVRRGHLEAAVHIPGTIAWDLRQERVVSLPVDAIVQRLLARTPFEPVRAGQPLAEVLAPAWGTALAEARALSGASSGAGRGWASAARARVQALGIPRRAVAPNGSIALRAPVSGVVSEIGAREGQAAPAGMVLFRINGTDSVWLEAALPQAALADVAVGTPADASVSALPGRRFRGTVQALLPQLDPVSRTQRARIVLRNPEGLLVAGMYADVRLLPRGGRDVLLVPTDAVIGNGDDAHVVTQASDGFRPVAVTLGQSAGGDTEVLAGLRGDERVVANGQFLIDSEASLSGALERLAPPVPDKPAAPASTAPSASAGQADPHRHTGERKILYWYDPAMPEMHSDHPGTSAHSGQPLLPRYADAERAP